MFHHSAALLLAALLAAPAANAQIVVRDRITPLPPISICQDGATHRTICTNLRLRPGALSGLSQFEGQPLEITGTPGAITCPFVDVQSVTVLPNEQFTVTATGAATLTVDFFGSGPAGDVFLLFLGTNLLGTPITQPPFLGPIHLDPAATVFVGLFAPQGGRTAYHTISVPANPALIGPQFFDQALALHASGPGETTPVDCFRF